MAEFYSEVERRLAGSIGSAAAYRAVTQAELFTEQESEALSNVYSKILVDLHATSSDNGNFIVIPEDEADNKIVKSLRLPIIIDLEKSNPRVLFSLLILYHRTVSIGIIILLTLNLVRKLIFC